MVVEVVVAVVAVAADVVVVVADAVVGVNMSDQSFSSIFQRGPSRRSRSVRTETCVGVPLSRASLVFHFLASKNRSSFSKSIMDDRVQKS